jgi:hypothetical protein
VANKSVIGLIGQRVLGSLSGPDTRHIQRVLLKKKEAREYEIRTDSSSYRSDVFLRG